MKENEIEEHLHNRIKALGGEYPQVVYDPEQKGKDAHNALSDAIFQSEHLFKIKNRNKSNV